MGSIAPRSRHTFADHRLTLFALGAAVIGYYASPAVAGDGAPPDAPRWPGWLSPHPGARNPSLYVTNTTDGREYTARASSTPSAALRELDQRCGRALAVLGAPADTVVPLAPPWGDATQAYYLCPGTGRELGARLGWPSFTSGLELAADEWRALVPRSTRGFVRAETGCEGFASGSLAARVWPSLPERSPTARSAAFQGVGKAEAIALRLGRQDSSAPRQWVELRYGPDATVLYLGDAVLVPLQSELRVVDAPPATPVLNPASQPWAALAELYRIVPEAVARLGSPPQPPSTAHPAARASRAHTLHSNELLVSDFEWLDARAHVEPTPTRARHVTGTTPPGRDTPTEALASGRLSLLRVGRIDRHGVAAIDAAVPVPPPLLATVRRWAPLLASRRPPPAEALQLLGVHPDLEDLGSAPALAVVRCPGEPSSRATVRRDGSGCALQVRCSLVAPISGPWRSKSPRWLHMLHKLEPPEAMGPLLVAYSARRDAWWFEGSWPATPDRILAAAFAKSAEVPPLDLVDHSD